MLEVFGGRMRDLVASDARLAAVLGRRMVGGTGVPARRGRRLVERHPQQSHVAMVGSGRDGGVPVAVTVHLHGARMLSGDYVPGGKARLQLKNIEIIRALAAEVHVPLASPSWRTTPESDWRTGSRAMISPVRSMFSLLNALGWLG